MAISGKGQPRLARCATVFPVTVVVGAAVPTAVCGGCARAVMVGRGVSRR